MATYPPLIIVPNQTGKLIGQNYSTQFFALHTGQSDYYMPRYLSSSVGLGENKERTEEGIDLSRKLTFWSQNSSRRQRRGEKFLSGES